MTTTTTEKPAFQDAKRQLAGLTAPFERAAIQWLVRRLPERMNSDHLSLIGFFSLVAAGVCYAFSQLNPPLFLHSVNVFLLLNWFGDSLDGSLARHRNKQRPRYGFYVDHIIDTVGFFFLIGGLGVSGYMSERVSFGLLTAYYMLMINSNLAAYTLGRFNVSYGLFGPTELRIVLAIGNVALIYHPHSTILGTKYLLYDVGGVVAVVGMAITFLLAVSKNIATLYRLERV